MRHDPPTSGDRAVLGALLALGVSAILTQLVFMRELLSFFAGNEMVLGVVLGSWLLLTGLGAAIGRAGRHVRHPRAWVAGLLLLLAMLPVGELFLLRALRNTIFLRGAMLGLVETAVTCFAVLLPYCLTSGFLLTLGCGMVRGADGARGIARAYLMDSLGMTLGGLAFTFVLVKRFDHFQCLYLAALLDLIAVLVLSRRTRIATVALLVAMIATVWRYDLNMISTGLEHGGYRVLCHAGSPYGDLVVTLSAGQVDFLENGTPLFSTGTAQRAEETVHYAMAQRPSARRVLLIGGGVSGTVGQILRYPSATVDYIELDPLVVRLGRQYGGPDLDDPRVRILDGDGRLLVRRSAGCYDAIIADVPEAITSQANRYYTREFFTEAAHALRPDGVLCLPLGAYENYVGEQHARIIATVYATLAAQFRNVLVMPAGKLLVLASDGPLTSDIATPLQQLANKPIYLTPNYLAQMLSPDRLADVARAAHRPGPLNADFAPVLYYDHLRLWASRFESRVDRGVLLLAAVGLGVYLLTLRPVGIAIFTTGIAASTIQVIILLAFQVLYGCVYQQVGLIVTMFMLGLTCGSLLADRVLQRWGRGHFVAAEVALAALTAALPWLLPCLGSSMFWGNFTFALVSLLAALLVGIEFPLAGKLDFRGAAETAGRLYLADMVGACLGAIAVSALLVPLFGFRTVCLGVAGMKLTTAALARLGLRPTTV